MFFLLVATCDITTGLFLPKLNDIDVDDTLWLQQDGATCHIAREIIQLLHETFPDRVLSHFGDQNCPPRSRDLTPLGFSMGLYEVKGLCYSPDVLFHT